MSERDSQTNESVDGEETCQLKECTGRGILAWQKTIFEVQTMVEARSHVESCPKLLPGDLDSMGGIQVEMGHNLVDIL